MNRAFGLARAAADAYGGAERQLECSVVIEVGLREEDRAFRFDRKMFAKRRGAYHLICILPAVGAFGL